MTVSVVVLARVQPGSDILVNALLAAGPQLRVGSIGQGVALQLFDDDATLIVTVEVPSLIQVPGEAQRLLGLTSEPRRPTGGSTCAIRRPRTADRPTGWRLRWQSNSRAWCGPAPAHRNDEVRRVQRLPPQRWVTLSDGAAGWFTAWPVVCSLQWAAAAIDRSKARPWVVAATVGVLSG